MYPIKVYADIYDKTYGNHEYPENKGHFGHLIIRDSNTVGADYLLLGCNDNETSSLKCGIRLNKRQVKQVISALNKFIERNERKTIEL